MGITILEKNPIFAAKLSYVLTLESRRFHLVRLGYNWYMKFLLTSIYANVADELPKLLRDKPENVAVAFIATAADA